MQAFDALSGTPLWERRFDAPTYSMHQFNSFASSTPAVDAKQVYVMWLANGRINLAALTHDGDEVWRRDVGPFGEKHGFGKSPVVVDDFVSSRRTAKHESAIVAFDAASGDVRWQIPRPSGKTSFATPCLLDPSAAQKLLLTLSTTSGLRGIDAATGEVVWQGLAETVPERCVSSPIVAQRAGIHFVRRGRQRQVSCRGPARQREQRARGGLPHAAKRSERADARRGGRPAVRVARPRHVSCHDVATGEALARARRRRFSQLAASHWRPHLLRVAQGEMVVLAADREFKVLARNTLDEPCHATPAVAHNRLYVRTESTLLCIGEPAGR